MSRGLGKNQRLIIDTFKNSNRKEVEAMTIFYLVLGLINSFDEWVKIDKLDENKENIKKNNLSRYKSVLKSIKSLEKRDYLIKEYKIVKFDDFNDKKILKVKYVEKN